MAGQQPELRWSVERRLEFIEFRLYWEGRVNRGDIVDTFGVSVNQSSTDINRYIGMAPDNLAYDKSARTYVRTDDFIPKFLKPSATGYLSQLRSLADGVIEMTDAWVGVLPDFDATPTPVRGVNPATLREVISAIRHKEAIKVKYQSLSQPEPKWRWIAPHAIAFDGFRWHARAWCEESKSFKDFLLSRMLETGAHRQASCDATSDADWNAYVTLEIGPHPELSQTQKGVIALDYGMHDGKAEIKTRKALLYYTLKRLGLDTDPAARAPQDQQIVLLGQTEQPQSPPPDVIGGAIQ
ncbi:MAG: WYL domain-containing protein [Henriciella sp.]|nr:WYL domain-containing protein [Henriciella sp.]